ncbi:uncharacterized protein LOC123547240 isoform X2 [Mercenaria mercenaria]|uniref:uncharacterized protein LOC123547240 isoform X2 n=1 Tax=Mercenaria mercenaria TaxID=6596 RepID=UPI001E1D7BBF|nr:uncharacterized protein LOC123547240 isoform X2 [Mercenaria mercenaria]
MLRLTILLILPFLCSCFIFKRDQADWNGLKVTWGLNPFSAFNSVPRTRAEALSDGWASLSPGTGCNDNPKFKGERYIKDRDMGVILIFDANGYIAGIQIGFPESFSPNPHNYPFPPLKNRAVILDNGNYYVTAYFVDPATICQGRTADQFKQQGTGTGLWIQNGTDPVAHSITIPKTKAGADKSMWTEGACFYTMGLHYWYNLSKDMSCDNLYPVFLLYNGGVLNGFGWAIGMDLKSYSTRIEHPPQSSYGNFMKPPPDCLSNLGTMTTLHIYLTDSATADTC